MAQTLYCINTEKSDGYDDCDILQSHWGDSGMRTILLNKDDFATLQPWQFVSLLNKAYERGRIEYQEDLRRFIGVRNE